jgi:hypothetical protein
MNISAILDIDQVWADIESYIEGAAKYTHGRYTADDIRQTFKEGGQQLWIAYDDKVYGAVITEIISYPQMRTLIMHFTGGVELPKWKDDMLAMLRRFAKDHQCKVIESYGRSGWKRIFKNDGFNSKFNPFTW